MNELNTSASVAAADLAHVFHSWSAQASLDPIAVAGAEGAWFWDHDGKRYLDLASQMVSVNIGHQHPRVVDAIKLQAEKLCTIAPGFANETRAEAARLITTHAPAGLDKVFFTNGGADANEHAVRMARFHTGRTKVLAAYRSYHGATTGAIALTGDPRRWPSEPTGSDVTHFFGPYLYRSSFHAASPEEESARALEHLADILTHEGADRVAAIIVEPVVGTNGVLVPPPGYLAGVRSLCDEHGIVMIADEVMAGFGRCGTWFAIDNWDVAPDLITFAKGVNSGYVPLGGVLISDAIAATFDHRAYPGGLTYSGHPLACAAAVAAITVMEDEQLIERSRRLGEEILGPRLAEIGANHVSVGEVRGLGCMWALELVADPASREPLIPFNASGDAAKPMADVVGASVAEGLWPFVVANRVHIKPPLVIDESDLNTGLDALDRVLAVADAHCS